MIELDIDMSYCMGEPDLEGVILHDESGEHESVEFVPKIDYDEMRDATARRKERCIELEAENAKLRELVRRMYTCMDHVEGFGVYYDCENCVLNNDTGECDFEERIHALGIEVDE